MRASHIVRPFPAALYPLTVPHPIGTLDHSLVISVWSIVMMAVLLLTERCIARTSN